MEKIVVESRQDYIYHFALVATVIGFLFLFFSILENHLVGAISGGIFGFMGALFFLAPIEQIVTFDPKANSVSICQIYFRGRQRVTIIPFSEIQGLNASHLTSRDGAEVTKTFEIYIVTKDKKEHSLFLTNNISRNYEEKLKERLNLAKKIKILTGV